MMKTILKTMNRIAIGILTALMTALPALAAEKTAAEEAYGRGDFEQAEKLYTETIEKEGVSAGILYNLGNTYYRLGKDGEAMLCYERAKRLSPGNEEINQNLNFLRNKVQDANKGELQGKGGNVEPDQESFIEGIYRMIAVDTQSDNWAVFAVMSFILLLGAVAMYIFTPNVLARKTGFFSGLVFAGFTAIFLIFAFMGAHQYERQDEMVLTDFTTELKQQPDEKSNSVSTPLHKGTKLRVLETVPGKDGSKWLKVKLNSDNVGWVKEEKGEIV